MSNAKRWRRRGPLGNWGICFLGIASTFLLAFVSPEVDSSPVPAVTEAGSLGVSISSSLNDSIGTQSDSTLTRGDSGQSVMAHFSPPKAVGIRTIHVRPTCDCRANHRKCTKRMLQNPPPSRKPWWVDLFLVFLGALISLFMYEAWERRRGPDLEVLLLPASDQHYPGMGRPVTDGRWLNLRVRNKDLRFAGRKAAVNCHGEWKVFPTDGRAPFQVPVHWSLDDPQLAYSPLLEKLGRSTTIPAGRSEVINCCAQFGVDKDAFMWSVASFREDSKWKVPSWRIEVGPVEAELCLVSDGGEQRFRFTVYNAGRREDFSMVEGWRSKDRR